MRKAARALALYGFAGVVVTACSGGGESSPTSPPGQNAVPASLTIQAGDGQEAPAGSIVPTHPAVLVRDAAGRPVSGVAVTFAVTGGAGALSAAAAVTSGSGVATAGDWTLGPEPGPNTLSAQVAGLPSVTFTAQGRPAPRVLADTTLGTGGGTITVQPAGDPAPHVQLIVPAGAYPTATRITMKSLPSIPLTLPSGVTQAGPILELGGFPERYADSLLLLRIPVAIPPGSAAAGFIRNPENGRVEMLSLMAQDDTSVTVGTRHFSSALMMKTDAVAGAPGSSALTASQVIQAYALLAPRGRLEQPINSGFLPGVDDWEFVNWGSYHAYGGHCGGSTVSSLCTSCA